MPRLKLAVLMYFFFVIERVLCSIVRSWMIFVTSSNIPEKLTAYSAYPYWGLHFLLHMTDIWCTFLLYYFFYWSFWWDTSSVTGRYLRMNSYDWDPKPHRFQARGYEKLHFWFMNSSTIFPHTDFTWNLYFSAKPRAKQGLHPLFKNVVLRLRYALCAIDWIQNSIMILTMSRSWFNLTCEEK